MLVSRHRSLRGSIANRVRLAIFSVFGENDLSRINMKSTARDIIKWKSSVNVKNMFRKLNEKISNESSMTWCSLIVKRSWPNASRLSEEKVAYTFAICKYILNPKTDSIKIEDDVIRKMMNRILVSFKCKFY